MRRSPYFRPIAMVVMGIIALYNVSTRPSFQTYRMVDIVTLVASGMLFGVGFAKLASVIRGPAVNAS